MTSASPKATLSAVFDFMPVTGILKETVQKQQQLIWRARLSSERTPVRTRGGASTYSWTFGFSVRCANTNRPLPPLSQVVPNDIAANLFNSVGIVEILEYREPNSPILTAQQCPSWRSNCAHSLHWFERRLDGMATGFNPTTGSASSALVVSDRLPTNRAGGENATTPAGSRPVDRIDMLKAACPKDLPSTPIGRLAAMEIRLQVMLAAVQTVRPALERFYQSLSDEQKARFNAIASADDPDAAAKDQRDLTRWCDEKTPADWQAHAGGHAARYRVADVTDTGSSCDRRQRGCRPAARSPPARHANERQPLAWQRALPFFCQKLLQRSVVEHRLGLPRQEPWWFLPNERLESPSLLEWMKS